jgi:ABC-2 type transport system permease protein
VSPPGTLLWFARHEARLAWRDWLWMMTAGHRRRARSVALWFVVIALALHGFAWRVLTPSASGNGPPDAATLVLVTGTLILAWSMMLSQAMESVTRAFYARGDLDLILTSPARAARLFAVRIAAMVVTILSMTLLLGAPFINVLAWRGGAHWLGAYAVVLALAMMAVAVSAVLAVLLFRAIGPRRTRGAAQIIAAVIGAAFAIGVQFAAIIAFGTIPRLALVQLAALVRFAPDARDAIWWPARAVLGDPAALAVLLGLGIVALAAAIVACAPRFGQFALATAGESHAPTRASRKAVRFRTATPAQALRRKEWTLLARDPWLMSQTLMQLLYLLPPIFMMWRSFYAGGAVSALVVPILIMAGGQLAGGLAWLAVSGEDAPDLIASAPVPIRGVLRAKAEAVLGGIGMVFGPLVVLLALASPSAALAAVVFVAIAAVSATAIQFWFRTQARRSLFRRRQTASRIATFAEALSSIGWAGTGAIAATGTWLAVFPGVLVVAVVTGAWLISPASNKA